MSDDKSNTSDNPLTSYKQAARSHLLYITHILRLHINQCRA